MTRELDLAIPVELLDVDTAPVIPGARVLIVDDTPANLIAAEAALEPLQRQLVLAHSGHDALGHLLEQDFAVVLLDVTMPEMDGYETARWIRSRERTQHLPIIFVGGDHDEAAVLRAYELGAVDFLFKPYREEVLRAKVQVFVALQERTDQLAIERLEREFENRRRDFETEVLRRERDRELVAKKELARLNAALAEHDRRKDSFMAVLGHELRNPLAPLLSCIDLVRENPTQPLTPRMVEILGRQAKLLVRLVDDLLDMSRIKADKIELRPEVADLGEILDTAMTTSRPIVEERRHRLVVNPPANKVAVVADTVRIVQVICNLLSNAARYTAQGGRIVVDAGIDDENFAYVRVTDNGIGIPPELQETVFEMFAQERASSAAGGGLGLGLALARRLVEMHNGTIGCASQGRGLGSAFAIRIPREGSSFAVAPRTRTRDGITPVQAASVEAVIAG